ncbi:MAG TPA: MoxR family ATPase [Candidatus Omnitrophica bacterium]|nr:MoxR family ATPase [Candidatus Omnitrophota bacterium]
MEKTYTEEELQAIQRVKEAREKILCEMSKVIVGQQDVIDEILTALFARGHALVVGVPGLAKTMIVRSLAELLDLEFKRIQFTPDLMPSDIIGTDIIEGDKSSGERKLRFIKGPIFCNILLADEINRTPPKTQSALLEAMQEYRVTAGGITYNLDLPFFVLATQNPIEMEGTYPLPEAQLDRFMFNVYIDYPGEDEEKRIIKLTTGDYQPVLNPLITKEEILFLQNVARKVPVSDHVINYATALVRATRPNEENSPKFVKDWVNWGAGVRATQFLILGAKIRTIMRGDYNVSCEDVRAVSYPVLRHRIIPNFNAEAEGIDSVTIIKKILETVKETPE